MTKNVLKIIQKVCSRIGIPQPVSAVGSTDQQILQLVSICEAEGQDQATRYPWSSLHIETTFTTIGSNLQIALPSGFDYILNDTIWNRTLRRPIYGGTSAQKWQQDKAMQLNSPFNEYRIIGGSIYLYPIPAVGNTCAYEYMSQNWVTATAGGTSAMWTNDADTPLLDDQLIILGTIWRWKAMKGLDYAEDFKSYETRITDAMGRDGGKPRLDLNGGSGNIVPAIYIPAGNFAR